MTESYQIVFVPFGDVDVELDCIGLETKSRLDKALEISYETQSDSFYLAGGICEPGQKTSGAELMADYLEQNGIHNHATIEMASLDTRQNIDGLFDWIFNELPKRFELNNLPEELIIRIVSDRWHLGRIKHLVDTRMFRYARSFAYPIKFFYCESFFQPTIKRFFYEIKAYPLTWLDPWGLSWFVRRNRQHRNQS